MTTLASWYPMELFRLTPGVNDPSGVLLKTFTHNSNRQRRTEAMKRRNSSCDMDASDDDSLDFDQEDVIVSENGTGVGDPDDEPWLDESTSSDEELKTKGETTWYGGPQRWGTYGRRPRRSTYSTRSQWRDRSPSCNPPIRASRPTALEQKCSFDSSTSRSLSPTPTGRPPTLTRQTSVWLLEDGNGDQSDSSQTSVTTLPTTPCGPPSETSTKSEPDQCTGSTTKPSH